MPGGRRIPVTVDADTKGDFDKAADGLDKVARKADDADGNLRTMSKGAQALDAEINKTAYSVKALRDEFERTGDVGLLKDAKKLDNARKGLERLRKEFDLVGHSSSNNSKKVGLLGFALDEFVPKITKAAGSAIVGGVESGVQSAGKFASSNPWIAAGIAAGITLGVPAIGGAITAAVGGGVIAGGLLLAAKDPRVGAAWGAVGASAMEKLTGAASVFVDPLVHGAQTFGDTLDRIMPSIQQDFAGLAPVADKLFSGAAGFVEKLMPGIDAMSHEAGPILTMFANELPRMGAAVSTMMEAIASGGEGGKQALHDLLVLTEGLVISTGNGIAAFEKWYQAERSLVQVFTGHFGDARKSWENLIYGINDASRAAAGPAVMQTWKNVAAVIGSVGPAAHLTADQLKTLSGQISATTLTTDTLAGQMTDKLMGSLLGMSHATLGVAESLTGLHDTFAQNGLAIDKHTGLVAMNTQAGQRNREGVLSAIESNLRMYDTQIASGVGADVAAQKYGENTKALHDQLREAGLTEGQVHDLIGEYGNVPAKVNTDIAIHGLTDAINGLENLLRQLNGLTYTRTITIDQVVRHIEVGPRPGEVGPYFGGLAKGGMRKAQIGMFIPPSDPGTVLTGEPQTGGEWLIPARGIDTKRAAMLGKAALSGYDLDVVPKSGYASPVVMSASMGGAATHVQTSTVDPNALARAFASALNGMTVVMDGQTVGQIQGRQANLLTRGG